MSDKVTIHKVAHVFEVKMERHGDDEKEPLPRLMQCIVGMLGPCK